MWMVLSGRIVIWMYWPTWNPRGLRKVLGMLITQLLPFRVIRLISILSLMASIVCGVCEGQAAV